MGISLRWTTLITTYEPPGCFIDEQIRGPYSFWHHRHYFSETDGGTEIVDEVHYALPGGFLAPLAHALFVRRQLERIFDHRAQVIAQEMSGNGTEGRSMKIVLAGATGFIGKARWSAGSMRGEMTVVVLITERGVLNPVRFRMVSARNIGMGSDRVPGVPSWMVRMRL